MESEVHCAASARARSTTWPAWYARWVSCRRIACLTVNGSPRMVTLRSRSSGPRAASSRSMTSNAESHSASRAARSRSGRGSNSPSRLRSGFSPSVVRKSVQRDRRFPARCRSRMARELPSSGRRRWSASSLPTCRTAASASRRSRRNSKPASARKAPPEGAPEAGAEEAAEEESSGRTRGILGRSRRSLR